MCEIRRDVKLALLLAEESYKGERDTDFTPFGGDAFKIVSPCVYDETSNTRALIGLDGEDVYVGFKGTDFDKLKGFDYSQDPDIISRIILDPQGKEEKGYSGAIKDLLVDCACYQRDISAEVDAAETRVHAGFYFSLNCIKDELMSRLADVIRDKPEGSGVNLVLCGHSLGGALSTVLAGLFHTYKPTCLNPNVEFSIKLITFGAPHVGNQTFKKIVIKNVREVIRFAATIDPIPMLLHPIPMLGYVHICDAAPMRENWIMNLAVEVIDKCAESNDDDLLFKCGEGIVKGLLKAHDLGEYNRSIHGCKYSMLRLGRQGIKAICKCGIKAIGSAGGSIAGSIAGSVASNVVAAPLSFLNTGIGIYTIVKVNRIHGEVKELNAKVANLGNELKDMHANLSSEIDIASNKVVSTLRSTEDRMLQEFDKSRDDADRRHTELLQETRDIQMSQRDIQILQLEQLETARRHHVKVMESFVDLEQSLKTQMERSSDEICAYVKEVVGVSNATSIAEFAEDRKEGKRRKLIELKHVLNSWEYTPSSINSDIFRTRFFETLTVEIAELKHILAKSKHKMGKKVAGELEEEPLNLDLDYAESSLVILIEAFNNYLDNLDESKTDFREEKIKSIYNDLHSLIGATTFTRIKRGLYHASRSNDQRSMTTYLREESFRLARGCKHLLKISDEASSSFATDIVALALEEDYDAEDFDYSKLQEYLEQALALDPFCVRAHLIFLASYTSLVELSLFVPEKDRARECNYILTNFNLDLEDLRILLTTAIDLNNGELVVETAERLLQLDLNDLALSLMITCELAIGLFHVSESDPVLSSSPKIRQVCLELVRSMSMYLHFNRLSVSFYICLGSSLDVSDLVLSAQNLICVVDRINLLEDVDEAHWVFIKELTSAILNGYSYELFPPFLELLGRSQFTTSSLVDCRQMRKLRAFCYERLQTAYPKHVTFSEKFAEPHEEGIITSIRLVHRSKRPLQEACLNASICRLLHLSELSITKLSINALPQSIKWLKRLTFLGLDSNCLKVLPDEIGELVNLLSLSLQDNQLTQLPNSIGNLTSLTSLIVNDNASLRFPDATVVEKMSRLTLVELDEELLQRLRDNSQYEDFLSRGINFYGHA